MVKNDFGRIGVLAGGPSSERDISLRSGRAVYEAFISEGYDPVFIDVKDDARIPISDNSIDIAFIALHGRFGEDGTVQQMLEKMGVPYTGSGPEASKAALDKAASKAIFIAGGIPTPKHVVLDSRRESWPNNIKSLSFPVVVKPQFEGSSIGLSIVRNEDEFLPAVDKAFKYDGKVIVEEYIRGRELTAGILEGEDLPVIEIVPKHGTYDFEAKYKDPDTAYLVPAPIDSMRAREAKRLAWEAHTSLGCRSFSRVDMMMDTNGDIFVLEVNTIPGMTERSLLPKAARAAGIGFGKLCVKIVENALEKAK